MFVGVRQPKGRMCSQKCPHVIILESIPHHSPNFSSIGPLHLNHSNRTPLHFQWHSIQVISSLQRHRQRLRHRLRRHRLRRYRLRRLRRVTDVVLAALGPVFFKDPQPPQQQRLGLTKLSRRGFLERTCMVFHGCQMLSVVRRFSCIFHNVNGSFE